MRSSRKDCIHILLGLCGVTAYAWTRMEQLIFRALLENIIDDLNGIDYAGLN
jgi:hypothetical protein